MMIERVKVIGLLLIVLIMGYACEDQPADPANSGQEETIDQQKTDDEADSSADNGRWDFLTNLKGENEVPAVETNAMGKAKFRISEDGTSIEFKLTVANIENVLMAHIHNAPAGENGDIVVWLYPSAPPPQLIEGSFEGVLAEGTITADDLIGPLEGQTLDDLLEEMKAGNTYANVHTSQHQGGEIRGQIRKCKNGDH